MLLQPFSLLVSTSILQRGGEREEPPLVHLELVVVVVVVVVVVYKLVNIVAIAANGMDGWMDSLLL